jgi:hypothetical protein
LFSVSALAGGWVALSPLLLLREVRTPALS